MHLGSWGYGSGWVAASMALYAVALALGGLGGQRPKARKLASRLAERDAPVSDELRALLDDPVSRAENYASLLVVLVILVLMVFKPYPRARSRHGGGPPARGVRAHVISFRRPVRAGRADRGGSSRAWRSRRLKVR